jgi:fatty acid desaturase
MSDVVASRDENELALRPPQFGLRTLFAAMAGLCILFSLMAAIGAMWSLVLVFFLCLAIGHVAGNAIGTTLRDRASEGARREPPEHASREANRQARLSTRQRLRQNTRLPRAATIVTLVGSALGALVGGAALAIANWQQITPGAVALAIGSSAVLGGFAGFLLSSFFSVFGPALREAVDGEKASGHKLVSSDT